MTTAATVAAKLILDANDFVSGLDAAAKRSGSFASTLGSLGGAVAGVGVTMAGVAVAGAVGLGAFLVSSAKSAMDSENAMANLEATLKSTKGVAGMTAEALLAQAAALQEVTKFSDEAIVTGQSMLLTFTNIGKDVFPQATEAMLNMAEKFGGMDSASIQLGKALNDPIAGVTALRRVGVQLTDTQENKIKAFMAVNDIVSAQKIILGELTTEFGGLAVAAGTTTEGAMIRLGNAFDDIKETVGNALLPVLNDLMTKYIMPLVPRVQELAEMLGKNLGAAVFVLGPRFQGLMDAVGNLVGTVMGLLGIDFSQFNLQATLTTAIGFVADLVDGLTAFVDYITAQMPGVTSFFQPLMEKLPALINAITNIGAAFQEQLPAMRAVGEDFMNWLAVAFGATVPQLIENITGALNALAEFWREWGDEITAIVGFTFKLVGVVIGGALLILSGVITAALQLLTGDWRSAWNTVTDTIKAFWNLALSLVGTNLKEFLNVWKTNLDMAKLIVTTIFRNIVEAIGEKISEFVTLGKSIIGGIVSGIQDAVAGLVSAAVEAALAALAAAKKALGIKSPSALFRDEIGKQIMAGMALGIRDAMSLPQIELSRAAILLPASSPQSATAASSSSHANFYAPITIQMPSGGNAADLLRELQMLGAGV